MSTYSEPVSTSEILYHNLFQSSQSLGELADYITAHFGQGVRLNQFSISVERIQVRGCMCCHDSDFYEMYVVIEKRKTPCEYTSDRLVDSLAKT